MSEKGVRERPDYRSRALADPHRYLEGMEKFCSRQFIGNLVITEIIISENEWITRTTVK